MNISSDIEVRWQQAQSRWGKRCKILAHGSSQSKFIFVLQESAAGISKGSKSAMLLKNYHVNKLRARTVRCRVRLLRPTPRLAWLLKPSSCTQEEAPCRAELLHVTNTF